MRDKIKASYTGSWSSVKHYANVLSDQDIYNIVHDIAPDAITAPCGALKEFRSFQKGYVFCDRHCACSKKQVEKKRRATMLDRYGVEYAAQSPAFITAMKNTNVGKYGTECSLHAKDIKQKTQTTIRERYQVDRIYDSQTIKQKTKDTNLAKYGVEYAITAPEVRDKIKQSIMANYGVDAAMKSPSVQKKAKETRLSRFGAEYSFGAPAVREKALRTMLDRYGVEYAMHSPAIVERRKGTNQSRYGVDYKIQSHISEESFSILNDGASLRECVEKYSFYEISQNLGVSLTTVMNYIHHHGIKIQKKRSSYEVEIEEYLNDLGISFETNVTKIIDNLELDFYIKDFNLAIEFNGIYWHSSLHKDKNYHRRKYISCRNSGIRLIMINEDEWVMNKEIIKSKIATLVNTQKRGKGARKLTIRSIDNAIAQRFFDNHHIQGRTGSISQSIGAFDETTLVGAMAFNKQRGTGDIELIRFCSDGLIRPGLFSRLLKIAASSLNYNKIISFADLRYSNGGVYKTNGFIMEKEIPPDYRYFYKGKTYHKSSFNKQRLQSFGLDSSLTELQATDLLGIPRIYDCGKLKFIWLKPQAE